MPGQCFDTDLAPVIPLHLGICFSCSAQYTNYCHSLITPYTKPITLLEILEILEFSMSYTVKMVCSPGL